MSFKHLHFMYVDGKEPDTSFAKALIAELGQSPAGVADAIISVGGDGLLLRALRQSEGKPVFGVWPPGSNSRGFWTDHSVTDAKSLLKKLEAAEAISIAPLETCIEFTNGQKVIRHAFNDVAIERASGQSVVISLSAEFGNTLAGPVRVMGDGFVFSTALGSTGTNRSYGGPVVDVHSNVIILVGKGIYEPRGGLAPMVAQGGRTIFHTDFHSVESKRPVRIDYDGLSVERDMDGSPIRGIDVQTAPDVTARLLVTGEPGLRSFGAMVP